MRCRKGDLAVIVNAPNFPQYLGRIVTCVAWDVIDRSWLLDLIHTDRRPVYGDDRDLRPLRDSDGTDETLSWIDVPKEVTA